jgi:hypothetical protein
MFERLLVGNKEKFDSFIGDIRATFESKISEVRHARTMVISVLAFLIPVIIAIPASILPSATATLQIVSILAAGIVLVYSVAWRIEIRKKNGLQEKEKNLKRMEFA